MTLIQGEAAAKQAEDGSQPAAGSDQKLSKRAKKRLLKRQTWLDSRAERKAIQKQKRKAKMGLCRAEGRYDTTYSGRGGSHVHLGFLGLSILRSFATLILCFQGPYTTYH